MIRFINLTHHSEEIGGNFAFFDTVRDIFYTFNGNQVWVTWQEFEDDFREHYKVYYPYAQHKDELIKFKALCPNWLSE